MGKRFEKTALRTSVAVFALAVFSCAPLPQQRVATPRTQQAGVPLEQRPSPNFDARRPNYVIIHHTSDSGVEESLAVLTDAARQVSAHYLIGRDGTIFQLVDEQVRAWHAGESYWGGQRDLNSASIGIELDNNGREPFAEPQVQ